MPEPSPRTESELIELIRASDVRAPEELHRKVESLIAEHSGKRRPTRFGAGRSRLAVGLAGAVAIAAVLAIALAVGLSGGGKGALTVREASVVTLGPATMPAPAQSVRDEAELRMRVDDVGFPYWEDNFGWRSTGARIARVDGRAVTTVFYEDAAGRQIGYAIFAGTPAPKLQGGTEATRDGVPYRVISANGTEIISWLRKGHLCVVAGRGVSSATLLKLASWTDHGAVAS